MEVIMYDVSSTNPSFGGVYKFNRKFYSENVSEPLPDQIIKNEGTAWGIYDARTTGEHTYIFCRNFYDPVIKKALEEIRIKKEQYKYQPLEPQDEEKIPEKFECFCLEHHIDYPKYVNTNKHLFK